MRLIVRSVTGSNLADISQFVGKQTLHLLPTDASTIVYEVLNDNEKYRVDFIKKIIDVKDGCSGHCPTIFQFTLVDISFATPTKPEQPHRVISV